VSIFLLTFTQESNSFRDCESIPDLKQTTLLDAAIFKHVILAWMPESSAMDGNGMITNNNISIRGFTSL